jgi:Domain of unknown function (DUF4328)
MDQILDHIESGTSGLKDNSNRAKWAIRIFWALIAIYVISIISNLMEWQLLENVKEGKEISIEKANFNDLRQSLVAILESLSIIATIVFFILWYRRAYNNLRRIGVRTLEYSETDAAWSFFIPFVNLVRPFKIVREIVVETQEELTKRIPDYIGKTSLGIVGIWWAFFIIRNLAGSVALRAIFDNSTIDQMIISNQTNIVLSVFDIITAIVTVVMIKQISREESLLFDTMKYGNIID